MHRRRLRIVSSSDEEDDGRHLPAPHPPPSPPQEHRLQDEEMDDLIVDDIEIDFQTVALNSANPTPSSNSSAAATTTTTSYRQGVEPIPLDISDEEPEDIIADDIETDFQTAALNFANPTPSSNNSATAPTTTTSYRQGVEPIRLDISNEEPENITIGESFDNSFPEIVNGNNNLIDVSESPVHGVLERLGLRLRREWLDSCLQGLQASVQGFQRLDDKARAKLCFQQFLWSDMNFCGAGVLPPNVHTLHLVDLKGPFVLQVDEIVNISSYLRGRYQNAAPGIKRCLKLSMTDGIQRVFGMEYRPIKDLQVLGPAGLKVAICNVNIRHGLLMLVPEVVEVLGGTVDELEAARQRLVEEVNKPPRGRRTRTGEVPPPTTRATLAAWPPRNSAVPGHAHRNHPANMMPPQSSTPGSAASIPANDMHRQDFATLFSRNNASRPPEQDEIRHTDKPITTDSQQGPGRPRQYFEVHVNRTNVEPSRANSSSAEPRRANSSNAEPSRENSSNAEPSTICRMQPLQSSTTAEYINGPSTGIMKPSGGTRQGSAGSIPASNMRRQKIITPISGNNAALNTSHSPCPPEQDELPGHIGKSIITNSQRGPHRPRQDFEVPVGRTNVEPSCANISNAEPSTMSTVQPLQSATAAQHINEPSTEVKPIGGTRQDISYYTPEDDHVPASRDNAERRMSPIYMDVEEEFMDDLNHHFIPSGDDEVPFTYLASLSAKCVTHDDETSVVRGKIKCFITAVKGFQYKERTTYELQVYVDDGSLISEIIIDHNVVQDRIGYTPQEVTSALASSDSQCSNDMKMIFKQYQMFLVNFEGSMVIEMSRASPVPVAVEMDQGWPASDAWLLLKRVQSSGSPQQNDQSHLNLIDLSP